jgi:microcompartment protein CcmL/EutN
MNAPPAIAVFEFESIAIGTRAADAMIKRATLDLFRVGTVQPGKHLVLIGGSVAAVEEARIDGLRVGAEALTHEIFLPDVHPQVVSALGRGRQANEGDALGIIETSTIPATVVAADRAVKTADVTIIEIRLGDGLGGKGVTHLAGLLHDVEAAIEAGVAAAERMGVTIWRTVIPIQHDELRECIGRATEFHV